MRGLKLLAATAITAGCLMTGLPAAADGLSINIGVGSPAPICPYGYFDEAPYRCAPLGYYGPEWFSGRVFIGAGPWFHGSPGFHGHVDNRFHPGYGYRGHLPERGERARSAHWSPPSNFRGNEERDGRGNRTDHGDQHDQHDRH
jgi:hypothetical protein